ncbi:MAG: NAD(+) diphosphatase [Rhodospirillales bacterium]|nr:NAD(+) diphosphatase [Rhodospirillales bacterium]
MTSPLQLFSGSPIDRASHLRTNQKWMADSLIDPQTRYLPMRNLNALIVPSERPDAPMDIGWQAPVEVAEFVGDGAICVFLGLLDGAPRYAVDVSSMDDRHADSELARKGRFMDVRRIAPRLGNGIPAILAQARAMIDWQKRHGFCSTCGAPSKSAQGGYLRICTSEDCGAQHFPRTDPVVIMLAVRGDKCLLGRQPGFPPDMYSSLAGFMEPGECIAEAARREVMEEAGIVVGDVHYRDTQPWPFPSSLMIGCWAEAQTEEITIDGEELEDARWFGRDQVIAALENPSMTLEDQNWAGLAVPPPMAIAHHLIKDWALETF